MDLFSKEQLRELAEMKAEPCVSLFMPTYHVESELAQNPIRLKNLMKQTRKELQDQDYPDDVVEQILKPLQELQEDQGFWLDQSDGLAAFITPDSARVLRLPLNFEELVVSGRRFHLKPLFPLIASNNRFYLLALSPTDVRLYQGTHTSISQVHVEEMPEHIIQALWTDDKEPNRTQLHTGTQLSRATGGGRDGYANFHGHGYNAEDLKHQPHDELIRFFQQVDEAVFEVLRDEKAPLVLAGVEYYLPIYRDVNSYQHLVDDDLVAGSPVRVSGKDLHAKAWAIVEPRFLQAQEQSLGEYNRLTNKEEGLASNDLHEIVPAAVFGRIDTAFVPIGRHRWGHYQQEANRLELHDEHQAGDDDLFDLVAVHTYMHGGTVHALRPENMPAEDDLAATFRFTADVAAEE